VVPSHRGDDDPLQRVVLGGGSAVERDGPGSANDPKGVQTWRSGSVRALSWTLEGGCGA
jgi:hypothetical protein